jgi:hypothetical protein
VAKDLAHVFRRVARALAITVERVLSGGSFALAKKGALESGKASGPGDEVDSGGVLEPLGRRNSDARRACGSVVNLAAFLLIRSHVFLVLDVNFG